MSLAELEHYITSWQRTREIKAQEKASYDYILAMLIGKSVAAHFSNDVQMPTMEEAYSHLFKKQDADINQKKIDAKTELSALRFKQFVKAYNKKFKQEVADKSE